MSTTTKTTDPLHLLPSEIVLRILDYATVYGLASLLRVNRTWKSFIDDNEDRIYSSDSKIERPPGTKGSDFLQEARSFTKLFPSSNSWKDNCKQQTLLRRNWNDETLLTRESTIRVGDDPVWRFRPDFKRRFFLSTSQGGGLFVTDFETGRQRWSLDSDAVRDFAHLEYQDGTAVWDREGNALEVWRTDQEGTRRGEFKLVAVLPHDKQTRGFQLCHDTLCVVSSQGEGYIYDMRGMPTLQRRIPIETEAVGHLDQNLDSVVYSLGKKGYHFYNKTSGQALGILNPQACANVFHVIHPASKSDLHAMPGSYSGRQDVFPPKQPSRERTVPIYLEKGPYPHGTRSDPMPSLAEDEWGAGMLDGDLFVGISRAGRVLICPDWRKALASGSKPDEHISIIECDSDGSTFDLGGWLSIRSHRILFEIQDRAYVIGLTDTNTLSPSAPRLSFAFSTSLAPQMATPISFMALYDDCIMSTYTTLRLRPRPAVGMPRAVPTKAIRVLSFAPAQEDEDEEEEMEEARESYFRRMVNLGIHPFLAAMMDPEQLEEVDSMTAEAGEEADEGETELEMLD